jgi:soluble lytic murein transglycosylase-like protein
MLGLRRSLHVLACILGLLTAPRLLSAPVLPPPNHEPEILAITRALESAGAEHPRAHRVARAIHRTTRGTDIDPFLVVAIIRYENKELVQASTSSAGATGIMQVMPRWVPSFRARCGNDLTHVETNICMGVRVLRVHLADARGSLARGLLAFNGCKSESCRRYPELVLRRHAALRLAYARPPAERKM